METLGMTENEVILMPRLVVALQAYSLKTEKEEKDACCF